MSKQCNCKEREDRIDRALKIVRGDLKRSMDRVGTMRTYLAILDGHEMEMRRKFWCSWCGDGHYQETALVVNLKPVCEFCVSRYTEMALGMDETPDESKTIDEIM